MTEPVGIQIEVHQPTSLAMYVPGPQGPAGVENVVVSATEPTNRYESLVWIDTLQEIHDPTVGTVLFQAVTNQTGDLVQWKNNAGDLLGKIDLTGAITTSSLSTIGTDPAKPGLIVKGASVQTANLTEWQDSSGKSLTWVNPVGDLQTSKMVKAGYLRAGNATWEGDHALLVESAFPTLAATIIRGAVSQGGNLTEWQDSTGALLAKVASNGDYLAPFKVVQGGFLRGGNAPWEATYSLLLTHQTPTIAASVIRGAVSQTADLTQWQNSTGRVLLHVTSTGQIIAPPVADATSTKHYDSPHFAFQSAYWNGTASVTETMFYGIARQGAMPGAAGGHRFFIGDQANPDLAALTVSGDGSRAVQIGYGYADSAAQLRIHSTAASRVGQIIRAAASQTGDLQQWQDSAGAVLARVTSSGRLEVGQQITLANPGVGNESTITFRKTNDAAAINVFEIVSDRTRFGFDTSDNPQGPDAFSWTTRNWESAGSGWTSLYLSDLDVRLQGKTVELDGNVYHHPDPYITSKNGNFDGRDYLRTTTAYKQAGTGTLSLTVNANGYNSNNSNAVWVKLDTDTTFSWGYGSTSTAAVQTGLAVGTADVTLSNGIKVNFSAATGGVAGDIYTFRVFPGGVFNGGSASFSKTVTASGDVEVTDPTKGVIIRSPNGTRYRITVSDLGALATTAV